MDYLAWELRGEVVLVGLNRPAKRNAVSDAFIEERAIVIRRAESEAEAGVIHGDGPHFCTGLDLAEHVQNTPFEGVHGSRPRWHEVFGGIQRARLPWFAALHGAVVGGGLELARAGARARGRRNGVFRPARRAAGHIAGGGASVQTARLMARHG